MKLYIFIVLSVLNIGTELAFGQISDKNWDFLLIREDVVKPGQIISYEESLVDLTLFLRDEKINGINYLTHLQDDYHYSHITILKDLNEIEGGLKAFVKGNKASDKFKLIWDDLNESLESHRFYVVRFDREFSYAPDGKAWLEEAPYRKWNYFHFEPGNEKEVDKILAAWKSLYVQKKIKNGYRIFRGVIGIDQPVLIFANWAKTPIEHHITLEENMELLGEEAEALWVSMIELSNKIKTIEGWYLPQYSYIPE